jgi:hypothetical protein
MAFVIAAAVAGSASLVVPDAEFLWLGAPIATGLGWLLGRSAAAGRFGTGVLMALGCTIGGAVATGIWMGLTSPSFGQPQDPITIVLGGVALGAVGILMYGLPALALLYPVAALWVMVVRRLVGSHTRRRLPDVG